MKTSAYLRCLPSLPFLLLMCFSFSGFSSRFSADSASLSSSPSPRSRLDEADPFLLHHLSSDFQKTTNSLCYQFQRCARAVSIPPPAVSSSTRRSPSASFPVRISSLTPSSSILLPIPHPRFSQYYAHILCAQARAFVYDEARLEASTQASSGGGGGGSVGGQPFDPMRVQRRLSMGGFSNSQWYM